MPGKKLYSIRDWNKNFEVAQSRRQVSRSWVPFPTDFGSELHRQLMRVYGPEAYAAWALIIQCAAKAQVPGVLADEKGPYSPDELSIITSCSEAVFELAIPALVSLGKLDVGEWTLSEWPEVVAAYQRSIEPVRSKCRNSSERRRARVANVESTLTDDEWIRITVAFGGRCAYCGCKGSMSQDHMQPISRGGSHSSSNVVPACRRCNSSKGARMPLDFITYRASKAFSERGAR